MKYQDILNRCQKSVLLLLLVFLSVAITPLVAQDRKDIVVSPGGDTVLITAIPVIDINTRLEEVNSRMSKFAGVIKPKKELKPIDSLMTLANTLLAEEEARISDSEDFLTLRNVDDLRKQWMGYSSELARWKTALTQRVIELENNSFEAAIIKRTWEKTEASAREQEVVQEQLNSIGEVISRITQINKSLKSVQDTVLIYQSQITDFQIRVNKTIEILQTRRAELQSQYFLQDSPPIWSAGDSTTQRVHLLAQFRGSYQENKKSISVFFDTNLSKSITQIILFILFLMLFYFLKKGFKPEEGEQERLSTRFTQVILQHYISSAFFLSITASLFIYSGIPTAVREFFQILLVVPAIIIARNLIDRKLYPLLLSIVFLFLIDEIQLFLIGKSLVTRILMLLEGFYLLWLLLRFSHKRSGYLDMMRVSTPTTLRNLSTISVVFTIFGLAANLFGYVNLATLITNTVISSILFGILIMMLVVVLDALLISLFKTKAFRRSNILKHKGNHLLKNFHRLFVYFGVLLWVRFILISVGVMEAVGKWLLGLFQYTWQLKSVSISIGGILAFFIVIFITVVITRFVRLILEDEVFPRIRLSRGVPGAISMVVRYILVAFGAYVAISAAGIDLDKFGLIAGALGVGIGFGLQGVVYNFIAGLILAFERPIQKGDTIEVGTLMGDVTEIGVRASTIRTYDGSEVIVPNGNLISNEVVNWTLSDRKRRGVIPVNVAYGSKPREVLEIIARVAGEHPEVLDFPKPWPLFDGFGDSSLKFRVLFWVDFDRRLSVTSEVAMNIYDALEEAGIHIPFPQQDLHIKSFDPTVQEIVFPGKPVTKKPARAPRKKPGGENSGKLEAGR